MERMIDLPEYQFKHFEKHSALLLGIIHIVNGSAERLQHASSSIEAMSIRKNDNRFNKL